MSDGGYKIRNQAAIHFITFAVVEWVDVFTRKDYRDIVLESLKHCQAEKGLLLHCWCIMSNHLHLIISAKNNDLSDILRDFFPAQSLTARLCAWRTLGDVNDTNIIRNFLRCWYAAWQCVMGTNNRTDNP